MKKNFLGILLGLIFIGLFNVVFFMVGGTDHPASVWISYSFIHFAYIMVLLTPLFAGKTNASSVFGMSLYSVSFSYFLVEFFAGLLFVFIGSETYKAILLIQLVLFGIYAMVLLRFLIANESASDDIKRNKSEGLFVKENSKRVKILVDKLTDSNANKALERVYDLLFSSPLRSTDSVKDLEFAIGEEISELERAVRGSDEINVVAICKNISGLIEERNTMLK